MRYAIFLWLTLLPLLTARAALSVEPGGLAPGFSLTGPDGTAYDLKETLKAHAAAVIVFVSVKCPYSNSYNERFNQLAADLKKTSRPTAFFAINSSGDETAADIKRHSEERKFTFPVLRDEKQKVADLYGTEKTPEAFIVSAEGKVIYRGDIDDDVYGKRVSRRDLLEALEQFYAHRKVTVPRTRSFGCTIKRSR